MDNKIDEILEPLWNNISDGYGCGCCANGSGISEDILRVAAQELMRLVVNGDITKDDIERMYI